MNPSTFSPQASAIVASLLILRDGSVYIGDFKQAMSPRSPFKVSASSNAGAQTYPIGAYVEYKKSNGETSKSDTETVGVPVGGKIEFAVVSEAPVVRPGEKATLEVTYKNTGAATAYYAQSGSAQSIPEAQASD